MAGPDTTVDTWSIMMHPDTQLTGNVQRTTYNTTTTGLVPSFSINLASAMLTKTDIQNIAQQLSAIAGTL